MAAVVGTIRTTKPPEAVWWGKREPVHAAAYAEFVNNYPGVASHVSTELDPDTVETIIIFDSPEVLGRYLIDLHSSTFWNSRIVYNEMNGIINRTRYSTTN